MARLRIEGDHLVVHLNLLERLAAFRGDVRVPLASVRHIAVTDRPWDWDSVIPERVTMGFAAGTAPNRKLATIGPRASTDDGKAFVVVYGNSRSVVVDLDVTLTPWALLVVSSRDADDAAEMIRRSTAV